VAVIADTHLPRGSRRLTDECLQLLRAADLILHAGDISTVAVLEELRALGPPVEAVWGNADEPALRELLPKECVVEVEQARIAMLHIPGPRRGREGRLPQRGHRTAQEAASGTRCSPKTRSGRSPPRTTAATRGQRSSGWRSGPASPGRSSIRVRSSCFRSHRSR